MGEAIDAQAKRPSVLVVEDEPNIRDCLVELFAGSALVKGVGALDEALGALRASAFDLIVTDIRLGANLDAGFQIMAVSALLSPHASVLALTGNADAATRAAASRLGAAHCLEKPVNLQRLADIASWCGVPTPFGSAM